MKAFIYDRHSTSDHSLILKSLLENGKIAHFKIPGILKSKKRSALFYYPCTLWDFTFLSTNKEIIIPRESLLLKSCLTGADRYIHLEDINDLLGPTRFFYRENLYKSLFHLLEIIMDFYLEHHTIPDSMKNQFYLGYLNNEGLLDLSGICSRCGAIMTDKGYYSLAHGNICASCSSLEKDDLRIPYQWVNAIEQSHPPNEWKDNPKENKEIRKKILAYFKTI